MDVPATRVSSLVAGAIALVAGFVLWVGFAYLTPTREAWDTDLWWYIALPGLGILCGVLGYLTPVRVWRWPLAVLIGEFAAILLVPRNDPSFTLFPIALPFVLIPLALAFLVPALIGAVLTRDMTWDPRFLW